MRKFGKRLILGSLGVAAVVVASTMAYFKGEQHGREAAQARIQSVEQARDENSRTISHSDGTRSVYIRSKDRRTLNKYHYSGDGELSQMTVYRLDEKGNALAAKIFDGRKEELFKVSYGYRKSDGVLAEERMFDSRKRRISPDDGKELPVWRVIHTWDENGKSAESMMIKGIGSGDSDVAPETPVPFVNPFTI